jgi:hemin uptake protein HemP
MTRPSRQRPEPAATPEPRTSSPAATPVVRIRSEDLFQQMREIEIDHEGRIYRLRMTQLNKLILTA